MKNLILYFFFIDLVKSKKLFSDFSLFKYSPHFLFPYFNFFEIVLFEYFEINSSIEFTKVLSQSMGVQFDGFEFSKMAFPSESNKYGSLFPEWYEISGGTNGMDNLRGKQT